MASVSSWRWSYLIWAIRMTDGLRDWKSADMRGVAMGGSPLRTAVGRSDDSPPNLGSDGEVGKDPDA
jgi:hypothetical protein